MLNTGNRSHGYGIQQSPSFRQNELRGFVFLLPVSLNVEKLE